MHTCFTQHMNVDPRGHKVGQSACHDDDPLALKEVGLVDRRLLLKGLQLSLSTYDLISANN